MSDPIEVRVPDIGDFTDVPVIEVLVKPGDTIKPNDSLITLESEKAAMEVPSPQGGVVKDVRVKVGDKISKGSVVVTLESQATETAAQTKTQQPGGSAQPEPKGLQTVPTVAPAAAFPASHPERRLSSSKPELKGRPSEQRESRAVEEPQITGNGATHASPSIRRFARELGVDLHSVQPTGPNGRITREDVQNFVKRTIHSNASGATGLPIAPWPKVDFAKYGAIERKPLPRIKRIAGPILHRNWVTIPHVTQNDDADVTDLEEFRKELNGELHESGVKVTMLSFLIKASIAALKRFPDFNTSLDREELVYKKYYHIGFAADTPEGLVVPVVRDADRKGIADLAKETAELGTRAREGKLSSSEMQGGTFTISSLGSIGGTYFSPIINAPEVAILGACRAAIRPVWDGKQFVPKLMQPLSLSYDHRVIDGAATARFTSYLAIVLADLRRALI